MYRDELYHYGVKGMKWGVRHDKPSSGSRAGRVAKTAFKITHPITYTVGKKVGKKASDVKKSKTYRSSVNKYRNLTGSRKSVARSKYQKKNIDGMSNQDLKKAIDRMNLERQYRDLTKIDIKRIRKGKKYVQQSIQYMSKTGK